MNNRRNKRRGRGFTQNNPPRNTLKVCTLSGTGEIGRNCNFIEYGDSIIMVDAGYSFPDQEMHGIDYVIPNISYLKKNKQKIKALFITHGHQDHIGALPYILKDLDYPVIYAGGFAKALIEEKLREFEMYGKVEIRRIKRNDIIDSGPFKVKFIGVNHSIPDSFSVYVESPQGNIFISGDYKIDKAPANEPETDYESLKQLRGKVDVALMESTNAYQPGKAQSETEIAKNLEEIIRNHKGRVVVAAFASLVTRLYSVMQIAQKSGKKVVLSGRSLHTSIEIARNQRYIDVPDSLIIDEHEASGYPDDKLIFLMTGSQAERYAALNRISLGEHKFFRIKTTDLVIMSASEIPENVAKIERMTDRLLRMGVGMINNKEEDVHASGHGLQDDMQMMYDLVQPKYVMPVHGSLTFRHQNKKNYVKWGHSAEKVLLTDDGVVWEKIPQGWAQRKPVENKPILIDGLGVGDIGNVVIKDRRQLSEYGFFVVSMNLSSKNYKLIGNPRFVSRGFIYMKGSTDLLKELENLVKDAHSKWHKKYSSQKRFETDDLRKMVEESLKRVIYKKTEREPIISVVTG